MDGDHGERRVHDAFDRAVCGAAHGNQSVPDTVDCLMMRGVDARAGTVQLIEEIVVIKPTVIDRMILISSGPSVRVRGRDILCNGAAQMDVDKLKPFTYAQYGLFLFHKKSGRLQLYDIQFRVYAAGAAVLLPEKSGRDIAAAGQDQMCCLRRFFRVGCREA